MSWAYLIESYWPGVSERTLERALARMDDGQERGGTNVLGSILIPEDEIALSVVTGRSARAIWAASARAGLPCERVVECLQIGRLDHQPESPEEGAASARQVF